MPTNQDIKHIVYLMFENRSFDHVFGDLPNVDGVRGSAPRKNSLGSQDYFQAPLAADRLDPGPSHEYPSVVQQVNGGAMDGFVANYAHDSPRQRASTHLGEVMRYFADGALHAFHTLAKEFVVCDRWFSSVPGPTWPNRLFALSGTSLGRVTMPESLFNLNLHFYTQRTLFDALDEQGVSWKVYCGDFPLSMLLVNQLKPKNAARYSRIDTFFKDVKAAYKTEDATFPSFTLLEPSYLWRDASDGHPPHDMQQADALLASIYNALRGNESLWNSTLLVVVFDEHGGFYDHVPPPMTVAPDGNAYDHFAFDELGVRVPAILISPWLKRGAVLGSPSESVAYSPRSFDHTSMLKFVSDHFALSPPLGGRAAQAQSFANSGGLDDVFLGAPRAANEVLGVLSAPTRKLSFLQAFEELPSELSSSIVGLSHYIESLTDPAPELVKARSQQLLSGHQSQFDIALDRASEYISKAKSGA
jgi:phospholipase C